MNILIVDDELHSLDEMETCIQRFGGSYSCITCKNPLEALDHAADIDIDVAFLDIEMPVMNGLELAVRLTERFPDIAIVFVTAYNNYAVQAFEIEALDYILKPVQEDRLFKALQKLAARRVDRPTVHIGEGKISINMFRNFSIRIDERQIKWNRKKSVELLAYLISNKEKASHKDNLCELFWPDFEPKRALMNLQTTIYTIRRALGKFGNELIRIEYARDSYSIHLKDAYIDVEEFENLLHRAAGHNEPALLEQAVNLYTGDYLEEEGWLWAEARKGSLHRKYVSALKKLK